MSNLSLCPADEAVTFEVCQQTLGLVALLLHYPSEDWFGSLGELKTACAQLPDRVASRTLEEFADYVLETGRKDYEELYVRSFDFSRNTNMYLTTHDCTDIGKQAEDLVQFKAFFYENGFEVNTEMPDYVPAILELCSQVDQTQIVRVLSFAAAKLKLLRARFIEAKLPHVVLLDVVLTVLNRLENPQHV